jgi:hypothetical protein
MHSRAPQYVSGSCMHTYLMLLRAHLLNVHVCADTLFKCEYVWLFICVLRRRVSNKKCDWLNVCTWAMGVCERVNEMHKVTCTQDHVHSTTYTQTFWGMNVLDACMRVCMTQAYVLLCSCVLGHKHVNPDYFFLCGIWCLWMCPWFSCMSITAVLTSCKGYTDTSVELGRHSGIHTYSHNHMFLSTWTHGWTYGSTHIAAERNRLHMSHGDWNTTTIYAWTLEHLKTWVNIRMHACCGQAIPLAHVIHL